MERWELSHGITSEVLNEKPVITPSLQWLWSAFLELSATRAVSSVGACPINMGDILAYCSIHSIVEDDRLALYTCMRAMDNVWMTWANKKRS